PPPLHTLSLHDALPISAPVAPQNCPNRFKIAGWFAMINASLDMCFPPILRTSRALPGWMAPLLPRDAQVHSTVQGARGPEDWRRSEEHTSELQSPDHLV